ncbi:MAG: hypothetical protein WAT53_01320 [Nitrosomonas sp.]|nr:hypothetical protein [Nitrosomonas sp.]
MASTPSNNPFRIDAWVVLPEHLYCVWTLPPGDADFMAVFHIPSIGCERHLSSGLMRRRQRHG